MDKRLSQIEFLIKNKSNIPTVSVKDKSIPDDVLSLISSNIDKIKTYSLVVIVLKFYGNLTKDQQIKILKKLGKVESKSLRGGNYNRDVVSRGLVYPVEKNGRDIIYSLTDKGKVEVDKILKQLKDGEVNGKK